MGTTETRGRVFRREWDDEGQCVGEYRRTSRGGELLAVESRRTVMYGEAYRHSWTRWDTTEAPHYMEWLAGQPGGAAVAESLLADQRLADLTHRVGFVDDAPWYAVADYLMESDDPADVAAGEWVARTFGG